MPKSTRNIGLSELRVGLLVFIALTVLIVLILNASGELNPFKSHLHLRARFADANGLREGSDVKLAGVKIGKVDRLRLMTPTEVGTGPDPKKIEAFLTLDTRIDGVPATERIRTDSSAQQASPSLLGSEMIVNITPGTALGQPVTENFLLPSTAGSTMSDLATRGTELAQKLGKLSDQLNEVVANVRQGKGTVGRLFNDESLYNNLNATISDAEALATQIKSGKGSAGKFIYDEALYNNANDIAANLKKLSADLAAGKGTAGKLLESDEMYNKINRIADRVNHSMDQIDQIIAGVNQGEGTLGKLITDESLYNNVNSLSSEGVKMLYDFRQNPKKYLTVKFELF